MHNRELKIISFNVNGVLNPVKRSKILSKLKKERAQIAFLQETHMSKLEHVKLKKQGFKYVFASSYKSTHKRGVAILISNSLTYEHESEITDDSGRFIKITGKLEGSEVTLLNVYAPPGSDWKLYKKIFGMMASSQGVVICGGDFNFRLNPILDSSGKNTQSNSLSKKVKSLMEELGVIDVWRDMHPMTREYTHFSAPHSVYSRIDYFFVFSVDRLRIRDSKISTIDLSDHCPIILMVDLKRNIKRTLWRINSCILNDLKTVEEITRDIKEFLEINDDGIIKPTIIWDTLKAVLRGKLISLAAHIKKCRGKRLADLQTKLKQMQTRDGLNTTNEIRDDIKKVQKQIDDIYSLEIQKNLTFLKQKNYDVGARSAKVLAYKLRKQQMENTIYKIKNPRTGQIEESREKIKECFEMFYRDLYKQPEAASEQRIEKFLNGLELSKVKDFQNEILTKPITIKEVNVAISKLKSGKSPGSDGYTGEWYKCLKSSLSTLLVRTFNWVLRTGETPPSWHEAVISVIPKENKDKQECGNYRPISVLNVDYKLFTSILARRLENILPDIINLDQTGFIQQRQTMDNIRRTLHIVDHATREKNCALIVGLDAEKAFDSVRWLFLYKIMDKFAFHSAFIKVIQSLYSKPTARIKVNGDLSDSFMLERGSRQGCPLSPLLFTLFIEPLGQLLRQSTQIKGITVAGIEHKVAMFADDVLVYLEEPEKSFNGLMILLKEFGNLSGYKLNISKTQVMTLNFTASTDLQNRYSLSWESQEIKYLGVTVTKDLTKLLQVNYEPLSLRITEDLHRWSLIPFLSLTSRVNTIKMSVLPKLLYLFRTLPIEVPEGQFGEWDKQISRFIWQ
uniref:Reverse transcriptase domain-containing protein n=1 Tax=Amphiprion ocellaris TaxID=80972 RepID=A0AAQ6ABA7_AMPOC